MTPFSEGKLIHDLRHYLPSQTPLKDFIHHNSLHAFQKHKFYDAIFYASDIFGFQPTLELKDFRKLYEQGRITDSALEKAILSKKPKLEFDIWKVRILEFNYNENRQFRIGNLRNKWKECYGLDIEKETQPLLFRVLSGYLDQGISLWKFPVAKEGFFESIVQLERTSKISFFRSKFVKKIILNAELSTSYLLDKIVGNEALYEQYVFDQQFSHKGWSGMVATLEDAPHTLLDERKIALIDWIKFELCIELDFLITQLGEDFIPLGKTIEIEPVDLFAEHTKTAYQEVLEIWQDAFEWSYYNTVLEAIRKTTVESYNSTPSMQAIFCIDERECSLRRHLESIDVRAETLGCPGFFGVEFYFQAYKAVHLEKLCPAPVTPKYLIKETGKTEKRHHEFLYDAFPQRIFGSTIASLILGVYAGVRMFQNLLFPKMSPAISNAFGVVSPQSTLIIENTNGEASENGLQIGFTIEEMTNRVEDLLKGIGMVKHFSNLVYLVAHGSSSANNPHHGAHDCGACSGRPGAVNARVFAHMANHKEVRALLIQRGIQIPNSTQFVAAMHDTASDKIKFYDFENLDAKKLSEHQIHSEKFEQALNLNAKERARRFASINSNKNTNAIRKAIENRSVSMFEPRPELGHGTNALCIVGRRSLTKNVFLDRRAFLNSYDYQTDLEGDRLVGVMRPLGPVCGGINLEYYFSRVDNHKMGAGTKLPHHVVGLIGVSNSCDGDLRPGLPLQMIEVHDPVRLLIVVEHFPEVVLKAIRFAPDMYEWYINEWVHLVVLHPEEQCFYYFKSGEFTKLDTQEFEIPICNNLDQLLEKSIEMETNYIVDATKENLSVHLIQRQNGN